MKTKPRYRVFGAAGAILCLAATALAQYQVHTWESFESGSLPPEMILLFRSKPENTKVVDYTTLGDPDILKGIAATECGRYGVEFRTIEADRFLSIVSPVSLDRRQLGDKGKALYQADFYIKGPAEVTQTVAVAAITSTEKAKIEPGKDIWTLYRLGMLQNQKTYFAFANAKPQPDIYLHQPLSGLMTTIEGWHRFQLVFEGQTNIHCSIDGVPTAFSPVAEPTFSILQPGIMVTSPADKPYVCYIDNLSIQWTMDEAAPLPQSPWVATSADPNSAAGGSSLNWFTNPEEAWATAATTKHPVLMMLYDPSSLAYQELSNNTFRSNPAAQESLRRFTLLRVDVNQLRGGVLSRQFGVFRVPTFIVVGFDGQEKAKLEANKNPSWAEIGPALDRGLAAATAPPATQ